jgi:hypothetical protein
VGAVASREAARSCVFLLLLLGAPPAEEAAARSGRRATADGRRRATAAAAVWFLVRVGGWVGQAGRDARGVRWVLGRGRGSLSQAEGSLAGRRPRKRHPPTLSALNKDDSPRARGASSGPPAARGAARVEGLCLGGVWGSARRGGCQQNGRGREGGATEALKTKTLSRVDGQKLTARRAVRPSFLVVCRHNGKGGGTKRVCRGRRRRAKRGASLDDGSSWDREQGGEVDPTPSHLLLLSRRRLRRACACAAGARMDGSGTGV